jgi:hypothetical protein
VNGATVVIAQLIGGLSDLADVAIVVLPDPLAGSEIPPIAAGRKEPEEVELVGLLRVRCEVHQSFSLVWVGGVQPMARMFNFAGMMRNAVDRSAMPCWRAMMASFIG